MEQCWVRIYHYDYIRQLIKLILKFGSKYVKNESCAIELNILLRTLKLIREEALKFHQGQSADFEENLTNRLFASGKEDYCQVESSKIIDHILSSIGEFREDLNQSDDSVSMFSLDFLHSDELILTIGYSKDVFSFLKNAAENKRKPKVFVAETYPDCKSLKMVEELSKLNVYSILIPYSHIYSLMTKVNKVIIACRSVYIDGTIKCQVGTLSAVLAAKKFSVPVYVCLPSYKLVPYPPFVHLTKVNPEKDSFEEKNKNSPPFTYEFNNKLLDEDINAYSSRISILPYDIKEKLKIDESLLRVWSPKSDFIPSGNVDLYITSQGGQSPSYLYAMAREFFHPNDINSARNFF